MSTQIVVIVVGAWTIAGVLAAVVFGRMIQETDSKSEEEEFSKF